MSIIDLDSIITENAIETATNVIVGSAANNTAFEAVQEAAQFLALAAYNDKIKDIAPLNACFTFIGNWIQETTVSGAASGTISGSTITVVSGPFHEGTIIMVSGANPSRCLVGTTSTSIAIAETVSGSVVVQYYFLKSGYAPFLPALGYAAKTIALASTTEVVGLDGLVNIFDNDNYTTIIDGLIALQNTLLDSTQPTAATFAAFLTASLSNGIPVDKHSNTLNSNAQLVLYTTFLSYPRVFVPIVDYFMTTFPTDANVNHYGAKTITMFDLYNFYKAGVIGSAGPISSAEDWTDLDTSTRQIAALMSAITTAPTGTGKWSTKDYTNFNWNLAALSHSVLGYLSTESTKNAMVTSIVNQSGPSIYGTGKFFAYPYINDVTHTLDGPTLQVQLGGPYGSTTVPKKNSNLRNLARLLKNLLALPTYTVTCSIASTSGLTVTDVITVSLPETSIAYDDLGSTFEQFKPLTIGTISSNVNITFLSKAYPLDQVVLINNGIVPSKTSTATSATADSNTLFAGCPILDLLMNCFYYFTSKQDTIGHVTASDAVAMEDALVALKLATDYVYNLYPTYNASIDFEDSPSLNTTFGSTDIQFRQILCLAVDALVGGAADGTFTVDGNTVPTNGAHHEYKKSSKIASLFLRAVSKAVLGSTGNIYNNGSIAYINKWAYAICFVVGPNVGSFLKTGLLPNIQVFCKIIKDTKAATVGTGSNEKNIYKVVDMHKTLLNLIKGTSSLTAPQATAVHGWCMGALNALVMP